MTGKPEVMPPGWQIAPDTGVAITTAAVFAAGVQ
jgi:hypothetical protein